MKSVDDLPKVGGRLRNRPALQRVIAAETKQRHARFEGHDGVETIEPVFRRFSSPPEILDIDAKTLAEE